MKGRGQSDELGDRKLTLNVGGVRHETLSSTLQCIPGNINCLKTIKTVVVSFPIQCFLIDTRLSLLAHLQSADENYDPEKNEFFFDRHARAFENILDCYRTGELHIDQSLCGNTIRKVPTPDHVIC